ncbi:DUF1592 domain-containing protein [Verrucomicrobia bacterium]|nr:DUF1592 domain-containing protein [Verrucomicrobiota bacterium]
MNSANPIIAILSLLGISFSLLAEDFPLALQSTFKAHCIKCHGKGGKVKGKVNLLELKSVDDLLAKPELLETLLTVLKDREMPPKDEVMVPEPERKYMMVRLQAMLRQVQKTQPFVPTPIRRMNRFQYNNAVVDLLELDREIFRLNERLMRRRDDYFHPQTKKMPPQVRISSRPLSKDIDNQRPEGFKGVASFPQDKRAEHGFDNRADHLTLSPLLMESFLKLSQTIVESPDLNPKECRSWDWLFASPGQPVRGPVRGRYEVEQGGPVKVVGTPKGRVWSQNMRQWSAHWSGDTQLIWMCREKGLEMTLAFESAAAKGLRIGLTKAPDYGAFELYLDDVKLGKAIDLYDPKVIRAPDNEFGEIKITPGSHTLKIKCVGKRDQSKNFLFGMDYIELALEEPSPKFPKVIRTETEVIRSRLQKLLRRAFRRPVDPETLDRFANFAQKQIASGASFEEAMRTVAGAILGMPDFLYFYETSDNEKSSNKGRGRQRISDFELASRLSLFFWSSIPDDPLLNLAESGKLSDPKILSAQIDRMLNDRRSGRFCENFPAQWLQLERLITSVPDPKKFPYFYLVDGYRTSMHMIAEPLLLFETVYIENRSIMELLDPKFTWENPMLHANYAGHSKAGHDVVTQLFKRVPLTDPRRGGVITSAAIMTMTATPTRTQPITRGAWVNAVIFNDPPEPPPADVPPLPEASKEELAKLTIRERLAAHRKREDCAGCHNKIDPLGFALENYGPTGVWRDTYGNGREVDVSGVLFNQHEFKTLVEFKQLILKEKHRFLRGFISHLLSYALGRDLGPADSPALDNMTAQAMKGQDQMRAVLKSIAMSDPFLHKNTFASTVPEKKAHSEK